jgi:hypothetical protein
VSPLKSLFPIETDLPNLPPSLPNDQTSLIVGQILGFDSNNDAPLC